MKPTGASMVRKRPCKELIAARGKRLADRFLAIGSHCAELPDLDKRTPKKIVGYDETGMWVMVGRHIGSGPDPFQ